MVSNADRKAAASKSVNAKGVSAGGSKSGGAGGRPTSNSGARAGPGQSNRGFNFSNSGGSSDDGSNNPANAIGQKDQRTIQAEQMQAEQAKQQQIQQQQQQRDQQQQQQSGLYPGLSNYEGIPKNVPDAAIIRQSGLYPGLSSYEGIPKNVQPRQSVMSSEPPTGTGLGRPLSEKKTLKRVSYNNAYVIPPLPPRPELKKPVKKIGTALPGKRFVPKLFTESYGIYDESEKSIPVKPTNIPKFTTINSFGAAAVLGIPTIQQSQKSGPRQKYVLFKNDVRSAREQMAQQSGYDATPENTGFGPYIETQQQADQINKNANAFRDESERNKLYTTSKLTKDLGLDKIPLLKNAAKSFDQTFELNKLPKERNSVNTPILGSNFVTFPSNQKMADVLAPITNFGASLADLGKAIGPRVKITGNKITTEKEERFEPSEGALFGIGKGLQVPKQFNPKFEEKPISYGTTASLIGASFTGGLSPFAKEISPKGTNIFKNFKSETIKPGKGGGGSDSGQYITIKVDKPYRPGPSIKESIQNIQNKFIKPSAQKSNLPVLSKPSDLAPMYNIKKIKWDQWAVKGITKPNKFQGFDSIKIAQNLKTGERAALASRSKNKYLDAKEIKELKISQPEEFVKGKDGNIDVQSFIKGHLKFDRKQQPGIEEIRITDQITGISKMRTSINMNMGKPSIGWIVPRGKPKSSMNDIFATPKDAQVKDFKKFLQVERIKTNEEIFSSGKGKSKQPGLLQKQATELKEETKLFEIQKVKLVKENFKLQKSELSNLSKAIKPNKFRSITIGLGSASVFTVPRQKQKQPQMFFTPQPQKQPTKQKQPQMFFTPQPQKQPTKQKQPQVPFLGQPQKQPQDQPWPQPQKQDQPWPQPQRQTQPIPESGRFFFPPFPPGAYFGSGGYESPESLKKGFAAYGISSDINIKTLPTYSRYSVSSNIFKEQEKEDIKIQNLFYGKPRRKSKSKKKSKK